MRRAFIAALTELADADPRVVLLTGDLGFHAIEPFVERFPDRFFNAGVAEQNMVGMATGLAESGFVPFVYSIAPFATLRPYEFIRNGPVHHQLPVRIVGIGGGFEYGHLGASHYALEDVGVMRMQPGMTVVAPADPAHAGNAVRATASLPGPIYYRIGKDETSIVAGLEGRFDPDRVIVIGEGEDALIVGLGSSAVEVRSAIDALRERGIGAAMGVVGALTAGTARDIASLAKRFARIITVEAHYAAGGLGSWVAESMADQGVAVRLKRLAVRSPLQGISGSQTFLHHQHGISANAIVDAVME